MVAAYVNIPEAEYVELPLEPATAFHWLGEHVIFCWPGGREQKGRVVEVSERNAEVRVEYWFDDHNGKAWRDFIVEPLTNVRLAG